MTSKLNSKLFSDRLNYTTRIGNPFFMGPILFFNLFLNQTKNTFFGRFDSSSFKLTNNSYLRTPFIIVGTYDKNDSQTLVNYTIKTNYYTFFWIHLITVFIVLINLPFILLNEISLETFIRIVIIAIFFIRYINIYQKRKELNESFIEIFEL
ncbi:hypothetical protein [Flavobacterium sp.]|uniref:hypothetical protein n=1 Tax=Flavobacterium sp. TaxID=239 RepID=UPI00375352DF